MQLPFSQACENNKEVILTGITPYLLDVEEVLEVGSGTGQHAVHFAKSLPHLYWQTSDLVTNHQGISAWIEHSQLPNVKHPIALNVEIFDWEQKQVSAIYSANALHIMSWQAAKQFIAGAASAIHQGGYLILYGPFNYDGKYTSQSNADFDKWLKQQTPDSAIRPFEAVDSIANAGDLLLIEDKAMPANNRLLIWRKANPAQPEHNV